MAGNNINWPAWGLWLLLAGSITAAILLFVLAPGNLRTAGIVGRGIAVGVIVISLAFDFYYHIYIDATFGIRRLREFVSLGLVIIGLGVIEALLLLLGRYRLRLAVVVSAVIVAAMTVWLIPNNAPERLADISHERIVLINWMRAKTPCNARFLIDERTEGAVTALTGRFALLEGMGPFLRVDKLPYVVNLLLNARQFFQNPISNEAFLRQHDISYVVVPRKGLLLGYSGPTGRANIREMNAAPFLQRILVRRSVIVYKVRGARVSPISPLLKGPQLHCIKMPVTFNSSAHQH